VGACVLLQVLLPYAQGALLDEVHKMGQVADTAYTEDGTLLTASVPRCLVGKLQHYMVAGSSSDGSSDGSSWADSDYEEGGEGDEAEGVQQLGQQVGGSSRSGGLALSHGASSSSSM
jgi:hypothetical protein